MTICETLATESRGKPVALDVIARANEVLDQYADLDLGLADASLIVLSERHDLVDLLTLDERHFRAARGAGGKPFRILPVDLP